MNNILRIGVVGLGTISGIYLKNLTTLFAKRVTLAAVTDIVPGRADAIAAEYHCKAFPTAESLLASPDVDIVLNLTPPLGHHALALAAVKAGKHVYNEKPLCIEREEAAELLAAADARHVRVGCAPDTFLGAGLETCRKVINDGWIGKPVAAAAFMMSHGTEHWHPNPAFYYQYGGGPLFDMGPYYLTALVSLLGGITRVSGSAQKLIPTRTVTSEPLAGAVIDVEVPTHIAGVLDFAGGAVGTLITSFDVWSHSLPRIEIYGTEGTLNVPDPNFFDGPVRCRRFRTETWSEMPLVNPYIANSRGLGLVDMAESIVADKPHRASGRLAQHVLEVMHGILDASATGEYYTVKTGIAPYSLSDQPILYSSSLR